MISSFIPKKETGPETGIADPTEIKLCYMENHPMQKSSDVNPESEKKVEIPLEALKELLNRPIAYHRIFAKITKSVTAGVLLSQLYYWWKSECVGEEEFYHSNEKLMEETCLTENELRSAKKKLKDLNIISIEKKGLPAKNYYSFNFNRLVQLIALRPACSSVVWIPHDKSCGFNTSPALLSKENNKENKTPPKGGGKTPRGGTLDKSLLKKTPKTSAKKKPKTPERKKYKNSDELSAVKNPLKLLTPKERKLAYAVAKTDLKEAHDKPRGRKPIAIDFNLGYAANYLARTILAGFDISGAVENYSESLHINNSDIPDSGNRWSPSSTVSMALDLFSYSHGGQNTSNRNSFTPRIDFRNE